MWTAGALEQTGWFIRANHGGGYQYRLCPLNSPLTEACMQQTPVPFAADYDDRTTLKASSDSALADAKDAVAPDQLCASSRKGEAHN